VDKDQTLTLTLDGQPIPIEGGPETLADLLAGVDERCAMAGRIVTALRLDGADEPAFREPQVVARRVSTLAQVDVESGTPAALALQCLGEAGTALHTLAEATRDVAGRVRAGEIKGGNADLVSIARGMATVLTITGAASLGLGIDFSAIETPQGTLSSMAERAARALDAIIAAQLTADWSAVARKLENDLAPVLHDWAEICRRLEPADVSRAVSRLQIPDPVR
jgi:hypothetical protein